MDLMQIRGVGEKMKHHFETEEIYTVKDLLFSFPKKYILYEIHNELLFSTELVCISGIVDSKPTFLKYRRNVNTIIFYVIVNNYKVKCVCFSSDYLRYKLYKGIPIILYGRFKKENKEFLIQNIFFDNFDFKIEVDYKFKNINNTAVGKIIKNALMLGNKFEETLPLELLSKYKLYSLEQYIYASHFPKGKTDILQVQRRRKYEEFFWYSVSLELLKSSRRSSEKIKRNIDFSIISNFIQSLPYELTEDQQKAIQIIYDDICGIYPMNRLIQGDVGCGKSIVAYISALMLVQAGYQAVIMVPTELLANQQFENIKKVLAPFSICIELLTSGIKNKEKEDILYRLMNNRVQIIVGTHALLEENVHFFKLGIVIIDEQHRFGVEQRGKLIAKYPKVDCLYLTATPIPRTLGLTSFGDLDITSIHSIPKNRMPVATYAFNYLKLDALCDNLKKHIANHEQVYIVVPLVIENENIDAMDIDTAHSYFLSKMPEVRMGIVHGKLSAKDKQNMMNNFKLGKIDILIATTVIEVGVDVPNATVMVILDANRYGLAQIHQLRGRVGRGTKKSYCYLFSNVKTERLEILEKTTDGFEIALEDFKLRGPGDYFGKEQSGFVGLNYADFQNDFKIWQYAKEDGEIYCRKFIEEKSQNEKFLELWEINNLQKGKIN